jgi:nickel-dependent lactate racemase
MEETFQNALRHPIGMRHALLDEFRPEDSVVIVVSDASRKTGVERILPLLLQALKKQGLHENNLSFIVAVGVHRASTQEEQKQILGAEIHARFKDRIYNHDAFDQDNLVRTGVTQRGTEVFINRRACACDRLILTGTVIMHYFAGFGGGRKSLMPGIAGARTIAQNHVLNLHPTHPRLNPDVGIGILDGNPVAEDMLEAAQMRAPDFILNTVLGRNGNILGVFAGELDAAHRAACKFASGIYAAPIQEKADLVIASVAQASNFIQSHKALVNACAALKPGGRVILLAPAPEGLGGKGFRRYLEMKRPEAVIEELRNNADINGQTALSTLQKAPQTILISVMAGEEAAWLGMDHARSLAEAVSRAKEYFRQCGITQPTCYVMPEAGITVPLLAQHQRYNE